MFILPNNFMKQIVILVTNIVYVDTGKQLGTKGFLTCMSSYQKKPTFKPRFSAFEAHSSLSSHSSVLSSLPSRSRELHHCVLVVCMSAVIIMYVTVHIFQSKPGCIIGKCQIESNIAFLRQVRSHLQLWLCFEISILSFSP